MNEWMRYNTVSQVSNRGAREEGVTDRTGLDWTGSGPSAAAAPAVRAPGSGKEN